ncbi:MAG: MarR family transcriptional regulator [bacterium]|nr:MarR family transcriptional regulator [bacterium]
MNKDLVAEIRSFNRFYTQIIGLLDRHILSSEFSLPEVRVMYEINHSPGITASEIIENLGLDKGYLSRILKKLEKHKLIMKTISSEDKRAINLFLSKHGQIEYNRLDTASSNQIRDILDGYSQNDIEVMVTKMNEIKMILQGK